jgi:hypothetical protein
MRLIAATILSLITCSGYAQYDGAVSAEPLDRHDSTRAVYIRSYPDHFFVWPVLKQRNLAFRIEDVPANGRRITYHPNRPYALGMGVYLFELVLELTGSLPARQRSEYIYGESRVRDLQLNIFGKKWGVDLYRQKYEGFYVSDVDANIPPGTPYPQRPDIYTRNLYSTVSYAFNNRRFSMRSAYNFTETQLKSSGSFLMFGSLNGFKTRGDSAILGKQYQAEFGADAKIMEIRSMHLGIAPGYTYSFIYKGFFLNGLIAIGPANNWLQYTTEDGFDGNDIKFRPFYIARIAMGYNGNRFFAGLSFSGQTTNARFDSVRLVSSSQTLKVLFGFRLREFGVLKRRVVEIPQAFGIRI